MKFALLLLVGCFISFPAFAELDETLVRQMKEWKAGDPPPARLLKFPDGKLPPVGMCGVGVYGNDVWDYVVEIDRTDLLEALLLNRQAETQTLRAVTARLITLKGPGYTARLLDGHPSLQPDLVVLSQLLRFPYVTVEAARIERKDMAVAEAERAFEKMRIELEGGVSWEKAYGKAADEHPDPASAAKNPPSSTTLISYLYSGIITPTGFDVLRYAMSSDLPVKHLQILFEKKPRVTVLKTDDAVYLYYAKEYYKGAD